MLSNVYRPGNKHKKTIETYKPSKMIIELLRQIVGTISIMMKETILSIANQPLL